MSEQTMLDLELDEFWNRLVVGGDVLLLDTAEAEVVTRLTQLPVPEPQSGFLDAVWMDIARSDPAPSSGELPVSVPVQPPIPIPLPERGDSAQERHWMRMAAAIAALFVVAVVSAVLLADRWRDPSEVAQGAQWNQSGGGPGKENSNPESPAIADPSPTWHVETNGRIEGAPVVANGVVFVGNQNNHVFAFDAATGLLLWEVNVRKPIAQTMGVADGVAIVVAADALFGLDAAHGDTRWQRTDIVANSSPAIAGDLVLILDAEGRMRALAIDTGEDRWNSEPIDPMAAFAVDEQNGSIVLTTASGMVTALALDDGVELWSVDTGVGALGVPLVAEGIVLAPFDGGVTQIDGATGEVGSSIRMPFTGVPRLALSQDMLIASTDSFVIAYDRETREERWRYQQSAGLTGALTLGSSSVYLPGNDRTLTALDMQTGEVMWILPLDDVAPAPAAATSEGLVVGTRVGSIYAWSAAAADVIVAQPMSPDRDEPVLAVPLWKSTGGPRGLRNPTGIAVAPTGEIWVCDTANDRLQIFDANGIFLREFGSHGAAPGQFDFGAETAEMDGYVPLGHHCSLDFDASGALYVADTANARVQRFAPEVLQGVVHACCTIQLEGTPLAYPAAVGLPNLVVGSHGTGAGEFLFASDVAVGPNGDIFVGDRHRLDIQRFDADGNYLETIGKPVSNDPLEPGTFFSIDGIAVDDQGRLYVADDEPQQVDRLEHDGSWTALSLTREDYRINGIAVDEFGNVFVAQINPIGGFFSIYDPSGALLGRVGTYGIGLGQFDATSGIALDGLGNVYATDWAMNRFQKFALVDPQFGAEVSP